MESGTVVRWLKQEGDRVEKGEPLYELDTEKVTQEVEADASGVLLKIAVQEGEVPVGQTIAVIGEEGEEVSVQPESTNGDSGQEEGSRAPARDEERERGRKASAEEPEPSMSEQITEVREPSRADGRIKALPLARRIAREGPGSLAGPLDWAGRTDRRRGRRAGRRRPTPAAAFAARVEPEVEELTSIRRSTRRRLTKAWRPWSSNSWSSPI